MFGLNWEKKKYLYLLSHFGYCLLICIFDSRTAKSNKNHLKKWTLRIAYDEYITSFKDLLKKDNSFKIHHKNIQSLAIELFQVKKRITNLILYDNFPLTSVDYNARSQIDFSVASVNTSHIGLKFLRYFSSKVWNMVSLERKNLNDVEMFKSKIIKWEARQCKCKLCVLYVHNIGYINISNN